MAHASPIAQLIEEVRDLSEPPLPNREIARRCGLSHSRIQQLLHEPLRQMPEPDTLRGLARGLRLPLTVVVERALASVGLPSTHPAPDAGNTAEQMRQIIESSTVMSPDDREYWLAMVTALEQQIARRANGDGRETGSRR